MGDGAPQQWFLTPQERGNPATDIDRFSTDGKGWIEGNAVRPLIHGSTYFRRLYEELSILRAGDRVYFTDWRGDADERLLPDGPTVGDLLRDLAMAGVQIRALLWRSHSDHVNLSSRENQRLGVELNRAGAEVLLDQRVPRFGSHHQKLFIIRHRGESGRDVAFVGGIDLCHSRRDDAAHLGDPQQQPLDRRYGARAPWHDAALELRGPVVGDLLRTFVERWDDPCPLDHRNPYRWAVHRRARMPRHPEPLPEAFPDPAPAGSHAVQLLRTYGPKHPPYPFAPRGERSVARAYAKAFARARSLIYVEDQYLWSDLVAGGLCEALDRSPQLRVIAVVPRFPDNDGRLSGPPNRLGQLQAIRLLERAAPGRVGIYDLENANGVPIYVHAKICIVDDVWLTCGSDNFNRRSWTNDSELTCAVIDPSLDRREPHDLTGRGDGARMLARDLRMQVWSEHLGVEPDDPALLHPVDAFDLWRETASARDDWHDAGRHGPPPRGQVRRHRPDPVSRLQRVWAEPAYRHFFDPDARPRQLRTHDGF